MENFIEFMKTDTFLVMIWSGMVILLITTIVLLIKVFMLSNKYKNFMLKLGDGKNIEEDLETYMYRVGKVEQQNAKIMNEIDNIGKDLATCIKKVGIVRYSAFQDTGSDLSFTLALLNEKNDGVILNGIYSREMSNIYAKPIEKGKSTYTLSEEEKQAIEKAVNIAQVNRTEEKIEKGRRDENNLL